MTVNRVIIACASLLLAACAANSNLQGMPRGWTDPKLFTLDGSRAVLLTVPADYNCFKTDRTSVTCFSQLPRRDSTREKEGVTVLRLELHTIAQESDAIRGSIAEEPARQDVLVAGRFSGTVYTGGGGETCAVVMLNDAALVIRAGQDPRAPNTAREFHEVLRLLRIRSEHGVDATIFARSN